MKFQRSITGRKPPTRIIKGGRVLILFFFLPALTAEVYAQRIAVLFPIENAQSAIIKPRVYNLLSKNYRILDEDLAASVFQANEFENPFNLSTDEARNFGSGVGCDYLFLLKAENLRRVSFTNPEYYESYAAAYVISARTGRLIFWGLKTAEGENTAEADEKLFLLLGSLAEEISFHISSAKDKESNEVLTNIAELPDENSPEAKSFRSPLPFKRLRPAYTLLANLYNITATVDALVDLDESGKITRLEIVRWAGYGLDESVIKTINEMQWRPASRDGKALPIRVLLRYNFKKIEKEE